MGRSIHPAKLLSTMIRPARSLANATHLCSRAQLREASSSFWATPVERTSGETYRPSTYPVLLPCRPGRSLRIESSTNPTIAPDRLSATKAAVRSSNLWPAKNIVISEAWSSAPSGHSSRRMDSQTAASVGLAARIIISTLRRFIVRYRKRDSRLTVLGKPAASAAREKKFQDPLNRRASQLLFLARFPP